MLHQQLPAPTRDLLDRLSRWLGALVALAAGLSAGLLLWMVDQRVASAVVVAAGVAAAAFLAFPRQAADATSAPLAIAPDYGLVGASLGLSDEPCALTDLRGALLIANTAYRERFGGTRPPLELGADGDARRDSLLARTHGPARRRRLRRRHRDRPRHGAGRGRSRRRRERPAAVALSEPRVAGPAGECGARIAG